MIYTRGMVTIVRLSLPHTHHNKAHMGNKRPTFIFQFEKLAVPIQGMSHRVRLRSTTLFFHDTFRKLLIFIYTYNSFRHHTCMWISIK